MESHAITVAQIRSVPLFSGLPEEMLAAVSQAASIAEFQRNEVIFHEKDRGTTLFLILSGLVKVSLVRGDGKEAILALLRPGEFFGEMALLDNRPRSASRHRYQGDVGHHPPAR